MFYIQVVSTACSARTWETPDIHKREEDKSQQNGDAPNDIVGIQQSLAIIVNAKLGDYRSAEVYYC